MRWDVRTDSLTHEEYIAVDTKGRDVLLEPYTNKSTAFPLEERLALDLEGFMPPAVSTIKDQLDRVYENYCSQPTDLDRFIYLASLQDRNETLFFRLLHEHIEEMTPIVYTPVVGEACQKFSHIYRRGRGLYIAYEQQDHIEKILANHPRPPAIIVVTDGERILGLGDQGAGGMGIPIGKLCLYTLCAGIPPYLTLPILLDVGTDNEERLADPLYLGVRHRRIRGDEYQGFIDRFIEAVKKVYPHTLLQWEDFLKGNAIKQLHRFEDHICSFNDDIQGTAGVVVAGIYGGLKISRQPLRDQRVLFGGAGASAQGIADLLVAAMRDEGLSLEEARRRIWTTDSRGLVTQERQGLEDFKATYARPVEEVAQYRCKNPSTVTLEETILNAKPTILIGTSGTPRLFTEPVVKTMSKINERPMVFPLSNPTSKSECTAEEAIRWSDGRAIVATGSPFPPVRYQERQYRIGQGNNAFIFPGVGLGIWSGQVRRVTNGMFLEAAKTLADQVTASDLDACAVYPELTRIRDCSRAVALAVIRRAVSEGHADERVLEDLEGTVNRAMWFPRYRPIRYEP